MQNAELSQKLQRHRDFLERAEVDRPMLACWTGECFPLQSYPSAGEMLGEGEVSPEYIRPELMLEDYDRLFQIVESIGDDGIYVGSAFWGIPWMEAILGCPVMASSDLVWAEPWLDDFGKMDQIRLEPANPWFQKLLEFTQSVAVHSGGRFPVGTTLLRGPSDMIAAIRGHNQIVLDFFDFPEEVHRLLGLCTDIWIKVASALLGMVPEWSGGYASGPWGVRLWTHGPVLWTQEDASASFSPDIYRRFLIEQDRRIARAFDRCLLHLHSPALYPIDQILEVEDFDVIEVNYDPGGPDIGELLPLLGRIQERKPLMLWGRFDDAELTAILDALPPRGLSLQPVVDSVEEAHRILQIVSGHSKR